MRAAEERSGAAASAPVQIERRAANQPCGLSPTSAEGDSPVKTCPSAVMPKRYLRRSARRQTKLLDEPLEDRWQLTGELQLQDQLLRKDRKRGRFIEVDRVDRRHTQPTSSRVRRTVVPFTESPRAMRWYDRLTHRLEGGVPGGGDGTSRRARGHRPRSARADGVRSIGVLVRRLNRKPGFLSFRSRKTKSCAE